MTGNRVVRYVDVLDRLVPPTRAATTAGGGFPTQSQRRWWQLQAWRHYDRLDNTDKQPQDSWGQVCCYLAPNSSREPNLGEKGGNQRRTEEDAQ